MLVTVLGAGGMKVSVDVMVSLRVGGRVVVRGGFVRVRVRVSIRIRVRISVRLGFRVTAKGQRVRGQ